MRKSLINERKDGCIGIVTSPIAEAELVSVENGKKFVAENLTWDKIVKRFEADYRICVMTLE